MTTIVLKINDNMLSQFGEGFHASTRKYMDSEWSSAAYNVIQIVADEIYADFVNFMTIRLAELGKEIISTIEFQKIIQSYDSARFLTNLFRNDFKKYEDITKNKKKNVIHIFDAVMNIMPKEDIESLFYAFKDIG